MRFPSLISFLLLIILFPAAAQPSTKTIAVFVALADNEHQGIVPVPKAIGNGGDPDRNLYWGAGEGLKTVFGRSKDWKLIDTQESPTDPNILQTRTYRHARRNAVLSARAYRGSAIQTCILDFETAVQSGSHNLVVYIGHNGLMDFDLPVPTKSHKQTRVPDCIVLCCKSEHYFKSRLIQIGGNPILLTTQFMYPGSFILSAALKPWLDGANSAAIRQAAGAAYAANQRISLKAGTGIFANLEKK